VSRDFTDTLGQSFFLKNLCSPSWDYVLVDYLTILLLVVSFLLMFFYQRKKEVEFDEKFQTASDYSLTVLDPCRDATDPDEWRNFFSRFEPNGNVACVTVAVDNTAFVSLLVRQRVLREKIDMVLDEDEEYDEGEFDAGSGWDVQESVCQRLGKRFGFGLSLRDLHEQLMDVQSEIRLAVTDASTGDPFKATKVYVGARNECAVHPTPL
jgi:hypothetical protein